MVYARGIVRRTRVASGDESLTPREFRETFERS